MPADIIHVGTSYGRFSTDRVPNPYDPNLDYFGRERKASEFDKRQEANAPWWLRVFASKTRRSFDLYRYNPQYFTLARFRAWKERQWRNSEIMSQTYIPERHSILGSDLATAHFIVHKGGKVKFSGRDDWFVVNPDTRTCAELPKKYVRGWYLEAVDASETSLRYEGLLNFVSLKKLKWLSLKNCPHVDNWFVDRLTGELGGAVEHLDLTGCTALTEEMLSCMYRCHKLKELDLTGVPTTASFKLGCLLLEDTIPGLRVIGVDYMALSTDSAQNTIDEAQN